MSTIFTFDAIGTSWTIELRHEIENSLESDLYNKIRQRIDVFDKTYSRFRSDSIITAAAHKAGTYELPDDSEKIFSIYRDLYEKTEGYMTPLIGDALVDAGYDASYSLTQKRELRPSYTWEEALKYNAPSKNAKAELIVKKPTWVDLGAAGKGYLVDIVGELIEAQGFSEYYINAGGDVRQRGSTVLQVGLEHPENFEQVIGIYHLQNKSLCGSAGNRRAWGSFTHIINPKTGVSPKHISAVWVSADTTLVADALTTCLFFVPINKLDSYTFEYLIVYSDGSSERSSGFDAEIFS